MEARQYSPHYTISDYTQWDGDWELWHGRAVAMVPSPSFRHQEVLFALGAMLRNQLSSNEACHCRLVGEHDWRISLDTVVRPDLCIVCEPVSGEFLSKSPTLIAELLSPSTEEKDRTAKRALYQEQGVPHYLLVEPEDGKVEALTLSGIEYTELAPADAFTLELHEGCSVAIPLLIQV